MNGKIYYQENDLRKEYEIKMKSSPEFHSLAVLLLFFVSNMFPQNLFPLLPFFLPSSFLHLFNGGYRCVYLPQGFFLGTN
jgi:hypothetical protein